MCQERSQRARQDNSGRKKAEKGISHKATNLVEHNSDYNASKTEDLKLFTIRAVQSNCMEEIIITLHINDTPLHMELDTGAAVSLISEETWRSRLHKIPLKGTDVRLRMYTGESIDVLGEAVVTVVYGEQEAKLPILVVPGNGPSLLGRNWLKLICLNWPEIKKVSLELDTLLST